MKILKNLSMVSVELHICWKYHFWCNS